MFGYTVFLKIGNLAASSLVDMYKDSYQLIGCEFGFAQGIDIKGQAQTEVKGGTFYVTYPHLPNRDMIQWMLDARKYQNGAIVVHDNQGSTLEKILFEKGDLCGYGNQLYPAGEELYRNQADRAGSEADVRVGGI